ncbi:fumarylacetoacetate hydrolase family protein [Streptomyces mirabilis]|uniref:fumarylacetoacetate hydrolase family protein n=1 Tax=Streptomyces mirabilis TaxID=68239 RepID=UPI003678C77E
MTRWITYAGPAGQDRAGIVLDGIVHGLEDGLSLRGLLEEGGAAALAAAAEAAAQAPVETVPYDDAVIRPLLRPPALRDAMCFNEHIRNCRPGELDPRHSRYPYFWFGNPAAILGARDDVRIFPESEKFDYELEIGAVIGTEGENLSPEEAEAAIVGYTVFCDWSARDLQRERLVAIKGKDGATTLGPVMVTKDEIEHRRAGKGFDLAMSVTRNGEVFTTGNWSSIDWSFGDIVSYVSRGTRIVPGDVIGSGTVGWGCLLEHAVSAPDTFPGWLKPGDRVELEVELIGRLQHRITEPVPWHPLSSGF